MFDPIRKIWVVFTPEELVRQNVLHFFLQELKYPITSIAVEKSINLLGQLKRFDVVIYNNNFEPAILIECKAPQISINQLVLSQASLYNYEKGAKYIMLVNGPDVFLLHVNNESQQFESLASYPAYEDL